MFLRLSCLSYLAVFFINRPVRGNHQMDIFPLGVVDEGKSCEIIWLSVVFRFHGFYRSRYSDPGYSSTTTTVRLETNLYDVKTEKLIWSGKSDTWSKNSKDKIINDVIKAVIKNLQNNKIITPK